MALYPGMLLAGFTMPACEQHFHDHDETWLILAGEGSAFLIDHEGRRDDVQLRAGDVLMIPAGYEHGSLGPNTFVMTAVNGTLAHGAHQPGHYYVERERYIPTLRLERRPSDRYPRDARFPRDFHGLGGGLSPSTVAVTGPPGRALDAVTSALRSLGAEVITGRDELEPGAYGALVCLDASTSDDVVRAAFAADKPVAALGDGLRSLVSAQVLRARAVAAPRDLHDELSQAGAVTGSMAVCTDTGLVTAASEDALEVWIAKLIEVFGEGGHPMMGRSAAAP
jgi:hypothetical protein